MNSKYKDQIESYFSREKLSDKNEKKLNFRNAINFLKKILIYMLSLMKLVNHFLELKKSPKKNEFKKSEISSLIMDANENLISKMKSKIKIDSDWLQMNLESLIAMFDIRDFMSFLV